MSKIHDRMILGRPGGVSPALSIAVAESESRVGGQALASVVAENQRMMEEAVKEQQQADMAALFEHHTIAIEEDKGEEDGFKLDKASFKALQQVFRRFEHHRTIRLTDQEKFIAQREVWKHDNFERWMSTPGRKVGKTIYQGFLGAGLHANIYHHDEPLVIVFIRDGKAESIHVGRDKMDFQEKLAVVAWVSSDMTRGRIPESERHSISLASATLTALCAGAAGAGAMSRETYPDDIKEEPYWVRQNKKGKGKKRNYRTKR